MFRIFIFIALYVVVVGTNPINAASRFIPGINGLPLMGGLVLIPEKQIICNALNGRIIEAYAFGKNSPRDISSFYRATLQQLGWTVKVNNEFWRDDELLKIQISKNKLGKVIVRFSITPRSD